MKLKERRGVDTREYSVAEAVRAVLDAHGHGTEALEATTHTAENTMYAFSKLVQMLLENGALTDENVCELLDYSYESIK